MDNFEALVRLLMERENYWTRQSEKINLTPAQKEKYGKKTAPRPELDIVAFNPGRNEILVIEVKSYLDSRGVGAIDFRTLDQKNTAGRYKLFTCPEYRELVFEELRRDFTMKGLANDKTNLRLGLAAGKIQKKYSEELVQIFRKQEWFLWTPQILADKFRALAEIGYENDPFVLAAKLLTRNPEKKD